MKKNFHIAIAVILLFASCAKDELGGGDKATGSIYGAITANTGEPIRTANVQLNTGTQATLGDDGQYEFVNIEAGNYTLSVTKSGYKDWKNSISLKAGERKKVDVVIEKLPAALHIIDGNGVDIDTLKFGESSNQLLFSIFNDSPQKLNWVITQDKQWFSVSPDNGEVSAEQQTPVRVTVDRTKLSGGNNLGKINISSNSGSAELTITVTSPIYTAPTLNTLDITNPTNTSATFNGQITSSGNPGYTERGFVWTTHAAPTLTNNSGKQTAAVNSNASFSINVIGLLPNTSYYVCAYATNSIGTSYGNEKTFITNGETTTLSTSAATKVAATTATLNGTITNAGKPVYTQRGFCYGTNSSPTISDNKTSENVITAGNYSSNITGLNEGLTYYVRAYAIQNGAPVYGNQIDFTTIQIPVVRTETVTNIVANKYDLGMGVYTILDWNAKFNGTVVSVGTPAYTQRGFVYDTYMNPSVGSGSSTTISVIGNSTGAFSANVTRLSNMQTYYVRAYLKTSSGAYVYGDNISFQTYDY